MPKVSVDISGQIKMLNLIGAQVTRGGVILLHPQAVSGKSVAVKTFFQWVDLASSTEAQIWKVWRNDKLCATAG